MLHENLQINTARHHPDESMEDLEKSTKGMWFSHPFRDCSTKQKIKKNCSQQPLTWSRVGPSLAEPRSCI